MERAIAYSAKTSDILEVGGKTMFSKELIYIGQFEKGELQFEVTEETLHGWVATFNEMQGNGIEVPVPVEHTVDPEKRRGTVLALAVKTNSRGVLALFGLIQFVDEEAAKLARTAQVSVYVPPSFTDGKGNEYKRPIRHVALTDYPVIPKLDEFEAIAASHVPIKKEPKMALSEFAKSLSEKLGLKEEEDDKSVECAILSKFEEMKKEMKKEDEEEEEVAAEEEEEEEEEEVKKEEEVSASIVGLLKDNRQMKLSKLITDNKITKSQKDDLVKEFCGESTLKASLGGLDDKFDTIIKTLAKNSNKVNTSESTKGQALAFSSDNPLVKNAEARAKAFQSR